MLRSLYPGEAMSKKKHSQKGRTPAFNKYAYYEKAVQNPQNEVDFFNEKYKELTGGVAKTLREDFCGTGAISCAWVNQSSEHYAWGVDLDPEPIEYGRENHLSKLASSDQKRMTYLLENVLSVKTPKVDICFAFNFSYFIFKTRKELLAYFKRAYDSLNSGGVFFVDLFGGPDSQTVMTDEIEHPGFKYYWDCQEFNPITNECRFAIHFKRRGEQKRENVFVYEWRMWTLRELREIMQDAGFKSTTAYWEGEDEDGDGDGEFYATETAQNCDAWVTYIAAIK